MKPILPPVLRGDEMQEVVLSSVAQNGLLRHTTNSVKPVEIVLRMKLMTVMIEYALTIRRLRMTAPTKLQYKLLTLIPQFGCIDIPEERKQRDDGGENGSDDEDPFVRVQQHI